nr:hypothetical protein [Tanacetum cinerariifolium]
MILEFSKTRNIIAKSKIKVRNSRNKSIVSQVKSSDGNSSSSSEIAKLTHALNQQTSVVTTAMTAILKQFQATPPPAFVKAVKEIYVTYGAAVNYSQGNFGYRPLSVANQIQPPSFAQPNVQNNQNQFSQPQGYIRGNNFNQDTSYQASIQQNQVVPLSELKAITTQSGLVIDGPSVPMPLPFINPKDDETVEETLTDPDLAEDPHHLNIPYPLRMHKGKQQEKDEVQIHKFWQIFKQLHINITLADALILLPKYQKMLKVLLSNKKKLLEFSNTPLNENCSSVILKKLPEKFGDLGKFLISCGLPEHISTRMTLELTNWAICTPAGIVRDSFVLVRKFTFPADFIIVDYESDPRVPLILGRPFLRTAHALIDLHGEEMIIHDDLFEINHLSGNPTFSSYTDLTLPEVINPLSGSTTSSSPNHLLEEFTGELALITFPPGNNDLLFDIQFDLREIEYLLKHDPTKEMDSIFEDSVDECNLKDPDNNLVDTIPYIFSDKHPLHYSSPPLYDDFDDDLVELESSDFFPSPEYDMFLFENFSEVDALPSTNNKDKVFKPGILIHENLSEVIIQIALDKNVKKISISHASLILKDFDPPLSDHELRFHKEVLGSETLLSFSSENEEKVFKPGILTSKGVHTSLLSDLFHRTLKLSKSLNFESPMEIFPCSLGEGIRILDV